MKRILLPGLVCAAIGALIVLLVKLGDEPAKTQPKAPRADTPPPAPEQPALAPAETRTPLGRHQYLRELERSLERDDLKNAHWFRQKVCEDLDTILASETLTRNLIEDIRQYGGDVEDRKRRDVVLPILRVFAHPEATQIIAEEYYRSPDPDERMMLLEAMSHSYHDPKTAAVWAVERALNAETEEHRHWAFKNLELHSGADDLIVETGQQIYHSTTRPEQKEQVLGAISALGRTSEKARAFLRERIRRPDKGGRELILAVSYIENWGNERDAQELEGLAEDMPAIGELLRERAGMIRRAVKEKEGRRAEIEAEQREADRRRREEAEKAAEEEKKREAAEPED